MDVDEVREWCVRNLELINKALFSFQKRRLEEFRDKQAREDAVNALYYLRERITTVER